MTGLLEVRGLSVTFGGLRAVDNVSLTVQPRTLVGLIGPNGAGKTTFIDALTGFVPSTGTVTFGGQPIHDLPPHRRVRLGLGRTFQSLELFEDLTVRENLLVALPRRAWWDGLLDVVRPRRGTGAEAVHDALAAVGLADSGGDLPSELSLGRRKLVGVARALAARPRLVLLDEPAAGLDRAESAALGEQLRTLVDLGITILLVDHDMGLVLSVCDYVHVLDVGRVIADGRPGDVRRDPAVVAAYLGQAEASA